MSGALIDLAVWWLVPGHVAELLVWLMAGACVPVTVGLVLLDRGARPRGSSNRWQVDQ